MNEIPDADDVERCPNCGREGYNAAVPPGYRGGMCHGGDDCAAEVRAMDNQAAYFRERALAAEAELARLCLPWYPTKKGK